MSSIDQLGDGTGSIEKAIITVGVKMNKVSHFESVCSMWCFDKGGYSFRIGQPTTHQSIACASQATGTGSELAMTAKNHQCHLIRKSPLCQFLLIVSIGFESELFGQKIG